MWITGQLSSGQSVSPSVSWISECGESYVAIIRLVKDMDGLDFLHTDTQGNLIPLGREPMPEGYSLAQIRQLELDLIVIGDVCSIQEKEDNNTELRLLEQFNTLNQKFNKLLLIVEELKNRPIVITSDINFLEFDNRIIELENTVENQNKIIDELNKRIKKPHTKSTTVIYEKIVINEVDINTLGDDSASISEWVELYNPTGHSVDLSGWEIASTAILKKTMTIPEGTIIESGHFLIYSYQSV